MVSLTFIRSHASITSLPTTSLPDFTLITGQNGAGKTHLLQAIHNGSIVTDIAPHQNIHDQTAIRLFDWSTLVPQDTGYFSSDNIRNERLSLLHNFNSLVSNQHWLEPSRVVLRNYGFGASFLSDPYSVMSMTKEELIDATGGVDRSEEMLANLKVAFDQFESQMFSNMDQNSRVQLKEVSRLSKRPVFALREKDILSPSVPTWGQNDIFQQSFARLFVAYRDLKLANDIAQFRISKGDEAFALSDKDFEEIHGPPPWVFVNRSLMEAGLDFQINNPNLDDYTQFQPTLVKRSTGVTIPFGSLSSGEKVLMSFAFCVYYSNDRRQISTIPKMMLFDEIDAPLHPSMSRNVIHTITNTLVDGFGIKVIATTHSPSTVALAPEGSVHVMNPGRPGVHASSKAEALNILTVGVPTIAMSFDGRRQVFVESPTDAKVYDSLYKLLKPQIPSERSLEFVATGIRSPGQGDRNTGCEVVKRIVSSLVEAGNISVFGLIDWDGKNDPDDRLFVLSHGRKNGIENVVMDPLLIGLAICRGYPDHRTSLGLPDNVSYLELVSGDHETFQKIADVVSSKIFGQAEERRVTSYCCGLQIEVDARYFDTDDHALEGMIVDQFPFLKGVTRGQAGKLLEHVVGGVLADKPGLIPEDVRWIFEEMLERPNHGGE